MSFQTFLFGMAYRKWHPETFSSVSQKISFKNLTHEVSLKIKILT